MPDHAADMCLIHQACGASNRQAALTFVTVMAARLSARLLIWLIAAKLLAIVIRRLAWLCNLDPAAERTNQSNFLIGGEKLRRHLKTVTRHYLVKVKVGHWSGHRALP